MRRSLVVCLLALVIAGAAGCGRPGAPESPRRSLVRDAEARRETLEDKRREVGFHQESIDDVTRDISRPRHGLQLVARTSKEAYRLEEPIVLTVRLENVSGQAQDDKPRDISVYFEPFAKTPSGGLAEWQFKFHVRSEEDERPAYRSPQFEVSEKARKDYYHHVKLPPKAFIGRQFVFPPARARNWLSPGSYSITVSYEVSERFPYLIIDHRLSNDQVKALGTDIAYTRLWTGKLVSNRVTFRIRGRRRFLGIF